LHFNKISRKLGLEENEYLELVELFVKTSKADIKDLRSAINNKNIGMITGIAHSLKGAAMNLGLDDFIELAELIEKTSFYGELEETSKNVKIFQKKLDDLPDR